MLVLIMSAHHFAPYFGVAVSLKSLESFSVLQNDARMILVFDDLVIFWLFVNQVSYQTCVVRLKTYLLST
jgi:hypothetical protein